jgi:CRP-like cAMP-binding protein
VNRKIVGQKMSDLAAPPELQLELRRLSSTLRRRKGSFLFRRGDPSKGVFLIRKGKVSLRLDGGDKLLPSRVLGSGSILGLPATLAGATYSLTAEASEDAELDFVAREDFLALMGKDAQLCLQAMNLLSKEIASLRSVSLLPKTRKLACPHRA